MSDKIVLLDGHSILNRAFYGVPDLSNAEAVSYTHLLPEEPDNEKAELEAGTHLLRSGNGGDSHDRHAGGRNGLSCICHARNTCRGNGFLPV